MRMQLFLILSIVSSAAGVAQESTTNSNPQPPNSKEKKGVLYKDQIREFEVDFADATTVAQVLTEQFPGFPFSAEPNTKMVFGRAPESAVAEIEGFVDRLDDRAEKQLLEQTKEKAEKTAELMARQKDHEAQIAQRWQTSTLKPKSISADEAVDALKQLGLLGQSDTLSALSKGNVIILRGERDAIEEASSVLDMLQQVESKPEEPTPPASSFSETFSGFSFTVPLGLRQRTVQLRNLELKRAIALEQYGEKHPTIQELDQRIHVAKQLLAPQEDLNTLYRQLGSSKEPSIEDLERRYESAEKIAKNVGAGLGALSEEAEADEDLTTAYEDMLKQVVEITYELRMQLQTQQLDQAEAEIKQGRERLARRAKIKQQVIDRRVEELKSAKARTQSSENPFGDGDDGDSPDAANDPFGADLEN